MAPLGNALRRRGWWPDAGLVNPCLGLLPEALARDERLQQIWADVDPAQVWDSHAHLTGVGDGASGIRVHRHMHNPLRPFAFFQRRFFLNASCSDAPGNVDRAFVDRLLALSEALPRGYKTLLLAFDDCYGEDGRPRADRSAFVTPNGYARRVANDYPHHFEWAASIHPYREDSVEALVQAVADGARAIKWLPAAQGIDPASPRCDRFYAALARAKIPLICHAGAERAVHGAGCHAYGNPLLLRRALDGGVRVIVAHCASLGRYPDERGRERPSFELFARLMEEPAYASLLFADISAMTQANRVGEPLRRIIERDNWHPRLINGTDYPLPGVMPLFSLHKLAAHGFLDHADIALLDAVRRHNPLLFDFALKRRLRWQGKRLPARVFESRRLFEAGRGDQEGRKSIG